MSTALSTTQHYPSPQQSPDAPDWKQLLAERLEAHRAKAGAQPPVSIPHFRVPSSSSRASNIARAVASRYAEQPTYSEIMAATLAEHAAQQAEAAEYAAVQGSRAYSQQVHWEQEQATPEECDYATDPQPELPLSAQVADPREPESNQGFQEQYGASYPTSGTAVMPKFAERPQEMRLHQSPKVAEPSLEELLALSVVEPRAYLPSKLIEFPRELISAHKARPRLPDPPVPAIPAEIVEQESSQLRIFEVQPEATSQSEFAQQSGDSAPKEKTSEQPVLSVPPVKPAAERPVRATVSRMPASAVTNDSRGATQSNERSAISVRSSEADIPGVRTYKGLEWAAISLDKEPALYSRKRFATESDTAPSLIQPASIDRRVMAFAVDFSAVTGAFLGFLAVFAAATPRLPSGLTGIMLAGVVYAALWLLYQLMFFSLRGATAGMLYARIALCTFNDQNPSRSALRRRLAAWWLSCLPLGLGFFWSFLDEDNLSWHDRMTGMYQRTY